MKVAHVSQNALPNIGGMQIVVNQLIREQHKVGHECVLITRWRPWLKARKADLPYKCLPLLPRKQDEKGHQGSIGAQWKISLMVKLWQTLEKFDVWHIHEVYPLGYQIGKVLDSLNIPYVLTSHGDDLNVNGSEETGWRLFSPHKENIQNFLQKGCKLTAISNSLVATYISVGAQKEQITRIDNGVDYSRLAAYEVDRKNLCAKYNIPRDKKLIINIGRNSPKKGLGITEDVIRLVNKSKLDTFWVFVGPKMNELYATFQDPEIKNQVLALPSIIDLEPPYNFPSNDLTALLKLADVFYFPTTSEGFGLCILEAFASGTPVVSTYAEGVIDLITNENQGLLSEIGNAEQMAESIIRMLTDTKLRESIIARGIIKAEKYNWEKISSEYAQLYQKDNF
jgi:glycosyltransferase involved in cell wall biosynthesis